MKTRKDFILMKLDYFNMSNYDFIKKYGKLSDIEERFLLLPPIIGYEVDFFTLFSIN